MSTKSRYRTSRRDFLRTVGAAGLGAAALKFLPEYVFAGVPLTNIAGPQQLSGRRIDLEIANTPLSVGNRVGTAVTVNGTVPGPIIRLKEGQDVTLRVTNGLSSDTSVHWHGILLPFEMDGVPGVSFAGIKPGETFAYGFPIRQSGTYWYHSHSGLQEQQGHYGPLIIDPIEPEPFEFDRDYVVVLSDWSFENPMKILAKLKKESSYYNYQRPTIKSLMAKAKKEGFTKALRERLMWERMRMDQTDFSDVTAATYTYLMNGLSPSANWTGIFEPGEKVRLRFINSGAMTFFDVRIPGLQMKVVQTDGQNVVPVEVEEIRMGPAETYDVIVEPKEVKAYTVFAETIDRSGFARGTLATKTGMTAPIPARRPIPQRTMKDMGMDHGSMEGMDRSKMDGMKTVGRNESNMDHSKMDHSRMNDSETKTDFSMNELNDRREFNDKSPIPGSTPVMHSEDTHGAGNSSVAMLSQSRLHEPGAGLGRDGRRVLVYTDLRSDKPYSEIKEPEREIELHLTSSMERYMWSFDGMKFSEVDGPIQFRYGETLRLTFVNDTMMEHPLHLHGMWMYLENGNGDYLPRKHTINVKPAERLSVLVNADAPGRWAFHCHLLMHMEMGMFRVVEVTDKIEGDA